MDQREEIHSLDDLLEEEEFSLSMERKNEDTPIRNNHCSHPLLNGEFRRKQGRVLTQISD